MPLTIGETFAGYRVLRLLGSGGMGEVYLVQHPRLPRQEALKVLRQDLSSDTSFRERFIREADLASALRHPHVVGVHDRGEHDGQLWIAMDYIDGSDAARLLEQKYPAGMPVELVLVIVTAVASGLDYAHKKGLLHRDVKPANIIIADLAGDDPGISIADFGIARPLEDISGITTTNMTVGTVAYSAPEQLMAEPMDGRADQYALAATTYHLLTGTHLFAHSNPAVVISKHLNTTPPKLADRHPDYARLDEVLQVALSKDPATRFASCSAFAQALADESSGQGGASSNATTQAAARPHRPVSAPKPPGTSSAKGFPLVWTIVGSVAAAALVAGVVVWAWRPWDTEKPPLAAPDTTSQLPITAATTSQPRSPTPFISPPPLTPARDIAGMIVMLDPGLSGGVDLHEVPNGRGESVECQPSGSATPNGTPAHTINWDTTLRVRQALTALGVRTAMTRGNDDTAGPCVDERAAMANAIHPDAIVSIDTYGGPPGEGGFVVVYPSPVLDDALHTPLHDLSQAVHDQLLAMGIPPGHIDSGLDGRGGLATLNLAQYPAIQVELGNANNADDAALMDSPEGRQRYADAIVRGISAYLGATGPS